MQLYSHPASPFARKCRIIIQALEIRCEVITIDARNDDALRQINPLKKIPALVRDDGSVLFDSPVICEYLDHIGGGNLFPAVGLMGGGAEARWAALKLQALADGIMDAAVACRYQVILPAEQQNADFIARYHAGIAGGLDALEHVTFQPLPGGIGEIATGCALGYLDFRYPDIGWRAGHPKLAAWYAAYAELPEMVATRPPG